MMQAGMAASAVDCECAIRLNRRHPTLPGILMVDD